MRDAVHLLVADRNYRTRLERGARDYYLRLISPTRVVERLLSGRSALARSGA